MFSSKGVPSRSQILEFLDAPVFVQTCCLEANRILKNLQDKDKKQAANILLERIGECQACYSLVTANLHDMKPAEITDLVMSSKKHWAAYPLKVQIRLAAAKSAELMHELGSVLKSSGMSDAERLRTVLRSLAASMRLSATEPAEKFQPRTPLLDPLLHVLLADFEKANQSADTDGVADIGMDIEALMEMTALQSSQDMSPAMAKCLEHSEDLRSNIEVEV